eukprot:6905102-Lingulodinium_polyedra.AAC.1
MARVPVSVNRAPAPQAAAAWRPAGPEVGNLALLATPVGLPSAPLPAARRRGRGARYRNRARPDRKPW